MKNSFLFFRSIYESIVISSNNDAQTYLKLLEAVFQYMFYGNEVRFNEPWMDRWWRQAKESLDNGEKKSEKKRLSSMENGKKGGRPKKEKELQCDEEDPNGFLAGIE